MKTMHIGGALLATAAIAAIGLNMPAQSEDQPVPAAPAHNVSEKSVLLSVEGMH